ncbi:MAG: exodeoxyribonuclease VII large subunit [Thermodesulfobacteriota bacterium]|nr:exodeoxyribonuclease VII large subunit [Thermodesulfobacteriota bacterium]
MAKNILTVSELTGMIRSNLELNFSSLWIEGEISNLRIPSSGHCYFILKDKKSQIRCVIFRSIAYGLPYNLEDGLSVICKAGLTVYEPRGEYQLIVEYIEPKGKGELLLAFEQLKSKLEKEGLFDTDHKKPLPFLPQKIGIITSSTGAAIRDILTILGRRFSNLEILIYPVTVQGKDAPPEIVDALEYLNNNRKDLDVIILGRGGGSMEDLWAFNDEKVARTIYKTKIPVISAVGHEIDFTISDFVADLRAPTPSAAAELVVKNKLDLVNSINNIKSRLINSLRQILLKEHEKLDYLIKALGDPRKRINEYSMKIDDLQNRITLSSGHLINQKRQILELNKRALYIRNPKEQIFLLKEKNLLFNKDLIKQIMAILQQKQNSIDTVMGKLNMLNPSSILRRGYSITKSLIKEKVIKDSREIEKGEEVEVTLYKGKAYLKVEKLHHDSIV